jgi:EAL domain-containing protein (putative c-di-GMP-specific phosphodiesterase class I)
MTTVAEGVETAAQQRLLAALGCDEVQGYLFSNAVSHERIPEIIAAWSKDGGTKTQAKTIAA